MTKKLNKYLTDMMKTDYQTPRSRILDMDLEGALLNASVQSTQTMSQIDGFWDADDEYDQ